jgi:hypothetical protein
MLLQVVYMFKVDQFVVGSQTRLATINPVVFLNSSLYTCCEI